MESIELVHALSLAGVVYWKTAAWRKVPDIISSLQHTSDWVGGALWWGIEVARFREGKWRLGTGRESWEGG